MLSAASTRGHIDVPYATLDNDGKIVRHAPERAIELPFREQLAVSAFLEEELMNLTTAARLTQGSLVTQSLVLEMDAEVKKYGAKFAVVLLTSDEGYRSFFTTPLEKKGITLIDCGLTLTTSMKVTGEGHPNGDTNSMWSNCIADALASLGMVDELITPAKQ